MENIKRDEYRITENMLREEQAEYWGKEVIYRNAYFLVGSDNITKIN